MAKAEQRVCVLVEDAVSLLAISCVTVRRNRLGSQGAQVAEWVALRHLKIAVSSLLSK
jgi:hypothetical protein